MALRTERDGRVLTVTLDLPRNVLDASVVAELDALTRRLERDASVGAVVVTGGRRDAFAAGYDASELLAGAELTPPLPPVAIGAALRVVGGIARLPGGPAALARARADGLLTLWRLHRAYDRMSRMDKAFVAAINGSAAAAGCELALACDIRLMADGDFGIGLPEPAVGFNPGGGGAHLLARAAGRARAVELLLEARLCSPREALEIGLVHRVVAPERLRDEARDVAERLARRSPQAIWAVKRAVYDGATRSLRHGLRVDATTFVAAAVAGKDALRTFCEQAEGLPAETGTPWADDELLRAWQDGTAAR